MRRAPEPTARNSVRTVGAVYDRAFSYHFKEQRAVIDRAYRRTLHYPISPFLFQFSYGLNMSDQKRKVFLCDSMSILF
jgi:hypothetical protein